MPRWDSSKLTPKQEAFCCVYLETGNATEAYRRAYDCSNMKPASINRSAKKLMDQPNITSRITEMQRPALEKAQLTHERIITELARIAFFDIRKMYDEDGNPIPIHKLDADTAAAVSALDIVEEFEGTGEERRLTGYTKKYKTNSKTDALTMAMRHLSMFNDKLNIDITDELAARLSRSRKRGT